MQAGREVWITCPSSVCLSDLQSVYLSYVFCRLASTDDTCFPWNTLVHAYSTKVSIILVHARIGMNFRDYWITARCYHMTFRLITYWETNHAWLRFVVGNQTIFYPECSFPVNTLSDVSLKRCNIYRKKRLLWVENPEISRALDKTYCRLIVLYELTTWRNETKGKQDNQQQEPLSGDIQILWFFFKIYVWNHMYIVSIVHTVKHR